LSGFIRPAFGQYEQAIDEARKAIELDPDSDVGYLNLGYGELATGRIAEAEGVVGTASQRNLDTPYFSVLRFDIAFLEGDQAARNQEVATARKQSAFEDWIESVTRLTRKHSHHQWPSVLCSRNVKSGVRRHVQAWRNCHVLV
jgi:tetratricopeptide (TPR) repeat protein